MNTFGKKLLDILFFRSPAQAANPDVVSQSPECPFTPSITEQPQPIDSYYDLDAFGFLKMGKTEFSGMDAYGQLVQGCTRLHVQLGCDHLVNQIQPMQTDTQKVRGVAGVCHYCHMEVQQEQQRRIHAGEPLISPSDAVRQTLVCTECARISISGKLCCPRHSRIMDDGSGKTICLGVEDLESEVRKTGLMKILMPLLGLFTDDADISAKHTGGKTVSSDEIIPNCDGSSNHENH